MSTQPTLFEVVGAFALWHRPTRRHKWRLVGTADTHLGAVSLMSGSGEYLVTESGTGPDGTATGKSDSANPIESTVSIANADGKVQ